MKRILLFIITCISLSVSAQDLTGVWRGSFRSSSESRLMEMLGQDDRYKFEVQLDQNARKFSGVTYSYRTTIFYGKATCAGTINITNKKVLLEELKIVEQRISDGSSICLMTLFLQYSKVGDEEFLEGTYSSIKMSDSTDCGKGTVFLRKVPTSDFYKEPFLIAKEKKAAEKKVVPTPTPPDSAVAKKPAPVVKPITPATKPPAKDVVKNTPANKPVTKTTTPTAKKPPANTQPKTPPAIAKADPKPLPVAIDTVQKVEKPVVKTPTVPTPQILLTRDNELVKTITTNVNELNIKIYDNGTIDNDTISVYVDKKLVLSKQRLTERALTLKVKLDDDNPYHELVMVAENLGEIPPNTSLMIIDAGKKQYEVRITSTEQKNAVIVFKYEKP